MSDVIYADFKAKTWTRKDSNKAEKQLAEDHLKSERAGVCESINLIGETANEAGFQMEQAVLIIPSEEMGMIIQSFTEDGEKTLVSLLEVALIKAKGMVPDRD